jgi:hypothetical protein
MSEVTQRLHARCYLVGLVAVLLLRSPASAAPAKADVPIALPGEVLVVPPVGRYGRTPVPIDAVQAQLAAGTWQPPKSGDTLTAPEGQQRRWSVVPFKNGRVTHAALEGGYACFVVSAPEARVMLLETSGHALVLVNGEPRVGDVVSARAAR